MTLLTNSGYVLHVEHDIGNQAAQPAAVILSTQFDLLALAMDFMRLVMNGTTITFAEPRTRWARKELTALGKMLPYLKRFSELYSRGHKFRYPDRGSQDSRRIDESHIVRVPGLSLGAQPHL
jgi:hypothetical protein